MGSSELSSSAGQHQAQGHQMHILDQQQQQQLDEAKGSSLSVSASLSDTAATENDAVHVLTELEALHLSSSVQTANKAHTDADFLQQLFCCPLTKVSHVLHFSPTDRCSSVVML